MSKSNERAFPVVQTDVDRYPDPNDIEKHCGFTKREYFAGLAMESMYKDNCPKGHAGNVIEEHHQEAAALCVGMADALIKELEK